ncbi:MAG TPA: DUF3037 domain-containing protein [Terriglobales bacterium]|nr:DUF3037 domain-containing protein [Terriglobales bacterium]
MAEKRQLEFFLLRYVPDAVKEEFVNIGVVMFEPAANGHGFADVRFTRDWRRIWCLDPQADVEVLQALEHDIRKQIVDSHDRGILIRKLQDSFSNTIQITEMKACQTEKPQAEIEALATLYLEGPKSGRPRVLSGREHIVDRMQNEFRRVGVWELLMHGVPVSQYTKPGDHFKFDFGYRVGNTIKLFHAVSLQRSIANAVTLASRYPMISGRMADAIKAVPLLTAVIDDGLDRNNEEIHFALEMLEEAKAKVAPVSEMPAIAEVARQELLA